MAKKQRKEKNNKVIDYNKEGMLADLSLLEKEGVKVTDCGADGIKLENFGEGLDIYGAYIADKERQCHVSKRVYPAKRGYQLYTSNGKDFYLRLALEP